MNECIKNFKFLIALAGVLVFCGVSFAEDVPGKAEPVDYIQVYYFHATNRCKTCTTIEQYSREAVETYFKKQLDNRTVRFELINYDKPDNRHYLQDYQLLYRSLVIVRFKDGKQVTFKNLEKIWQHKGNRDEFLSYVKTEMEAFLKDL